MGVYDQAARYMTKRDPAAFFRWVAPRLWENWRFQDWIDASSIAFPGEPDRVCDTVAEFVHRTHRRRRVLVEVEFQAQPHPDMLERLAEYAWRLRREFRLGRGAAGKYDVASVLLNLTGSRQADELDLTQEDLDGAGPGIKAVVRTLREEDARETLARIAAGELARSVLPWVPLLRHAGEVDTIKAWKTLAESESDPHRRGDFGGIALVFSELAKRGKAWRQQLEGWNVQQSEQVLEWQREARQAGIKEGIKEGVKEGVKRVLQRRFAVVASAEVFRRLEALDDRGELDRWFDAALAAESWEAFEREINKKS